MVDLSPVRTICLLSEAGILSGYHFFHAITAISKSCSDLNSVLIIRAYGIMISSFGNIFANVSTSDNGKSKYDRKDTHNVWFFP